MGICKSFKIKFIFLIVLITFIFYLGCGDSNEKKPTTSIPIKLNPELSPKLILAVCRHEINKVRILLEKGADPNAEENGVIPYQYSEGLKGFDVLNYAIHGSKRKIIEMLRDQKVDYREISNDSITASIYKAGKWHTEIVEILLAFGADVNAKNPEGVTALMTAAGGIIGHIEIVKILLKKGADVNAKDQYDCPALSYATIRGHTKTVKILLKKGADVNVKAVGTAMINAAEAGHTETIKILLKKGADVNVKTTYKGFTALMFAVMEGHTETVKMLLKKGADVNVKADEGETALIIASYEGQTEIVKLLLKKGADVNLKNKKGETALILAYKKWHTEIINILKEKMKKIENKSK